MVQLRSDVLRRHSIRRPTSWQTGRSARLDATLTPRLSKLSADEGIKLERPMRLAGGTITQLRRDNALRYSQIWDISPSTSGSTHRVGEEPQKYFRAQTPWSPYSRLGAATGLQHDSICDDRQKKENWPIHFMPSIFTPRAM